MDHRPIRRFRPDPGLTAPTDEQRARWPLSVPAVAQLLAEGLEMPSGALVLVGENGSGKSTVMELLAVTLGLNPEGGSVNTQHRTRASEPESLGLVVERSPGASRWGYFLRDETLHGLYSYLEANPSSHGREPRFHELSHGEGFLQVLGDRARGAGTYLLDEPDAPRSPSAGASRWSRHSWTWWRPGRRSSSPHTLPSWPRCPVRSCWRSATGACARPAGTSWS